MTCRLATIDTINQHSLWCQYTASGVDVPFNAAENNRDNLLIVHKQQANTDILHRLTMCARQAVDIGQPKLPFRPDISWQIYSVGRSPRVRSRKTPTRPWTAVNTLSATGGELDVLMTRSVSKQSIKKQLDASLNREPHSKFTIAQLMSTGESQETTISPSCRVSVMAQDKAHWNSCSCVFCSSAFTFTPPVPI